MSWEEDVGFVGCSVFVRLAPRTITDRPVLCELSIKDTPFSLCAKWLITLSRNQLDCSNSVDCPLCADYCSHQHYMNKEGNIECIVSYNGQCSSLNNDLSGSGP